jgi:hypothetical protein
METTMASPIARPTPASRRRLALAVLAFALGPATIVPASGAGALTVELGTRPLVLCAGQGAEPTALPCGGS